MIWNSKASTAVAAILVSAVALLGGGALASEPLRLNATQMDAVTAGAAITSAAAHAVAVGKKGTLSLTDANTTGAVKNKKNAQTSGDAVAIAAGDLSAGTDAVSVSEVSGDTAYAGVVATTSGVAIEGDSLAISEVETSAKQTGVVYRASGSATTYVDGDTVSAEATVVPYGDGGLVFSKGHSIASTTEPGQVTASGSIMVVAAPGLVNGLPGKGKSLGKK